MEIRPLTRREVNARLLAAAALAGLPMGAGAFGAVQPNRGGNPAGGGNTGGGTAAPPSGRSSPLDSVLKRGRSKDWTLTVGVEVQSRQSVTRQRVEIDPIVFETAAVVFPVNRGTATSETDIRAVTGELSLDGSASTTQIQYQEGYQSGTRLGRWEMRNGSGRNMRLEVRIPMTSWDPEMDERAAFAAEWPDRWGPVGQSTLQPDPLMVAQQRVLDPALPIIQGLVRQWTEGRDLRSTIKPVPLARFLMGKVLEHCQPSGDGLSFNPRNGMLEGIALQTAATTAETGRGSEHDMVNLLATVYRAAGLPARTVIGYDVHESKGRGGFLSRGSSAKLRSWVEFSLFDPSAEREIWIPADVVRLRRSGSRAPTANQTWRYFGAHNELSDVMPFAFQFHPPTTVVAHGSPGFWGWLTTPEIPQVTQWLRFTSTSTPIRSNRPQRPGSDQDDRRR